MQARRGWNEIFKVQKVKKHHPKTLCQAKLFFKSEGEYFVITYMGKESGK